MVLLSVVIDYAQSALKPTVTFPTVERSEPLAKRFSRLSGVWLTRVTHSPDAPIPFAATLSQVIPNNIAAKLGKVTGK